MVGFAGPDITTFEELIERLSTRSVQFLQQVDSELNSKRILARIADADPEDVATALLRLGYPTNFLNTAQAEEENVETEIGDEEFGTGWVRDKDDERDYSVDLWDGHAQAEESTLFLCGNHVNKIASNYANVDWSGDAGSVTSQGRNGCCVQEAVCNAILRLQIMQSDPGSVIEHRSSPFLWKVARNLSGKRGNSGTKVRDTMKALCIYGVPPMKFWDRENGIDVEPGAFVYGRADNLVPTEYRRHDTVRRRKSDVLRSVKQMLVQGFPVIGGYYSFQTAGSQRETGCVRYAPPTAIPGRPYGKMQPIHYAHCVMFCGYDDNRKVAHFTPSAEASITTGALKFKNSWGTSWGEDGYGWLPYEFILRGLSFDLWTLMDMDMLRVEPFK